MIKNSRFRFVLICISLLLAIALIFFIRFQSSTAEAYEVVKAKIQSIDNPIPIHDSLWMEQLTWLDIRDQIASGFTSVILPTGGLEQNGPFVVTGKHNYVVEKISEVVAAELGNTLIAPVVKFVPQGRFDPPTGHMLYPGTIGLTEDTFEAVLTQICISLKNNGFKNVFLLGDSGGNQLIQSRVASKLSDKWRGRNFAVHHVESYYEDDKWGFNLLKQRGVFQQPDVQSAVRGDVHSDFYYESILASIDLELVRASQRRRIDRLEINSVALDPMPETVAHAEALIQARAIATVEAIRKMNLIE